MPFEAKLKPITNLKIENPYAKSKAMAAFEISSHVARRTSEGYVPIQEWEDYITVVSAAHEMMRISAKLADEAREDTVTRQPHAKDGTTMRKMKLIEKPSKTI